MKELKWISNSQFAFYLKNTPEFVSALVARLHALKDEERVEFSRDDAYDVTNNHSNTTFKVLATESFSVTDIATVDAAAASVENAEESTAGSIAEASTETDVAAVDAAAASVENAKESAAGSTAEVPVEIDVGEEKAQSVETEFKEANVGEMDAAGVEEGTDSEELDLMEFSQESALPAIQEEEVTMPVPFAGLLLLVVSVNYSAAKVVVDGPYAKWFSDRELGQLMVGETTAPSTAGKQQKVVGAAVTKKKPSSPRRSSRTKSVKSVFTPSKMTPKKDDVKGWQKNISRTVNGLDETVTNLQELFEVSVEPIVEENIRLKAHCSELKTIILDGQAQAKTRHTALERALAEQASRFTDIVHSMCKEVEGSLKTVTSKLDRQINETTALRSEIVRMSGESSALHSELEQISTESAALRSDVSRSVSMLNDAAIKLVEAGTEVKQLQPHPTHKRKPRIVDVRKISNIKDWLAPNAGNVYIGRGDAQLGITKSKWGNPFRASEFSDLGEVLEEYEKYVRGRPNLMSSLPELAGKQLGCHCEEGKCHGDILIRLADEHQRQHQRQHPVTTASSAVSPATNQATNQTSTNSSYAAITSQQQPSSTPSQPQHSPSQQILSSHNPLQQRPRQQQSQLQDQQLQHDHHLQHRDQRSHRDEQRPQRQDQQHEHRHEQQREKRKIGIYMDSNSRYINFHKLFPTDAVNFSRCGTVSSARNRVAREELRGPTDIILHLGTNDIETQTPEQVAHDLIHFAEELSQTHKCNIHVSALPPRTDELADCAARTNKLINAGAQASQQAISVVNHPRLHPRHMYDIKHCAVQKKERGQHSGVQTLAAALCSAVTGMEPPYRLLHDAQEPTGFDGHRSTTGPGR